MSLILPHPEQTVSTLTHFIQQTFQQQGKTKAVIAVSGGIDSALSLTLTCRALGADQVFPLLLPHHHQPMEDAKLAVQFAGVPEVQVKSVDISPMVTSFRQQLQLPESEVVRLGNIKARARMVVVYDRAKELDALVIGTENKSERHLGYFTRFGDAASDLEPISTLYKTQVRQLAEQLGLPQPILTKAPSAGLWVGQADEEELGFSYREADLVLYRLIDLGQSPEEIQLPGITPEVINKVVTRVTQMRYKLQVPYSLSV